MLLILLTWTFILSLGALYGHLACRIFQWVSGTQAFPHFSLLILLGWVLLASLTSALSLILPIGLGALLALSLVGIVYGIWQRDSLLTYLGSFQEKIKKRNWAQLLLLGMAILAALLFSSTPPLNFLANPSQF